MPRDMLEDELVPLLEQYGRIWELRVMLDPSSRGGRGYGFVTYHSADEARRALSALNEHDVQVPPNGRTVRMSICQNQHRIFVGSIPKDKGKDDLLAMFQQHLDGITDLIIYGSENPKLKNRGFCFLVRFIFYVVHNSCSFLSGIRRLTLRFFH